MDGTGFPHNDNDAPAATVGRVVPDRRGSDRYRAVCRVARVTRAGDTGLWRVRNISDDGMMLAADVAVTVGEPIEIALSESVSLCGKIVWTDPGRCGVAFVRRVNAAAILRTLADAQRAEGYRALRLPVAAEAILMLDGSARAIDLVDISQQGAGFRFEQPLEPGRSLDLVLPGGELRRRALVRWGDGLRGGLWFTQPLDRADLESIAHFARAGCASAGEGNGEAPRPAL